MSCSIRVAASRTQKIQEWGLAEACRLHSSMVPVWRWMIIPLTFRPWSLVMETHSTYGHILHHLFTITMAHQSISRCQTCLVGQPLWSPPFWWCAGPSKHATLLQTSLVSLSCKPLAAPSTWSPAFTRSHWCSSCHRLYWWQCLSSTKPAKAAHTSSDK